MTRTYLLSIVILLLCSILMLTNCSTKKVLIPYKDGSKYGFKTIFGQVIIKPEYDDAGWFYNGFICVKKGTNWGLMNEDGKLVTEIKYEYMAEISNDGLAAVKLNGNYGFIDKTGNVIIPFIYEEAWGFNKGISIVKKNGKWGFLNSKGQLIIPCEYDDFTTSMFSEGLIGVCKNNKWGFIDMNNKTVIPFDYTSVGEFSEGLAVVEEIYNKWGYIDHNNNRVIPFIYEDGMYCDNESINFKNGIAEARLLGKFGCINKKGQVVLPFKYYCMKPFFNGYAYVEIDNGKSQYSYKDNILQFGYVDSTGKEYLNEYFNYRDYDWKVSKAPSEIPDFSDTLKSFPKIQQENSGKYPDGVYTYMSVVSEDSLGIRRYDTLSNSEFSSKDTFDYEHFPKNEKAKNEKPKEEYEKWSLEKILSLGLNAIREEPRTYPDLNRIKEIAIGYGLMIDGGNFGEKFMSPDIDRWNIFKEKTIYKIISTESLRQATWNWVAPYYKQSFLTMHPFHQKIYKDIATYIKNYINSYDVKEVRSYLKRDERKFAQYDSDGKYNPYRKLSAFVDRLILVHNVLTIKDAKIWINKVANEVLSW